MNIQLSTHFTCLKKSVICVYLTNIRLKLLQESTEGKFCIPITAWCFIPSYCQFIYWNEPPTLDQNRTLSLWMCFLHVQSSLLCLIRNLSLPFLPSEVHAWSHTVRQKGLPCVRDRLGNPPTWVSPSRFHHHHLLMWFSKLPYPALAVFAGGPKMHTTQDVLRNSSHDHTRPWEQVADTLTRTHSRIHVYIRILSLEP